MIRRVHRLIGVLVLGATVLGPPVWADTLVLGVTTLPASRSHEGEFHAFDIGLRHRTPRSARVAHHPGFRLIAVSGHAQHRHNLDGPSQRPLQFVMLPLETGTQVDVVRIGKGALRVDAGLELPLVLADGTSTAGFGWYVGLEPALRLPTGLSGSLHLVFSRYRFLSVLGRTNVMGLDALGLRLSVSFDS
jgi:hypothetical protein